MVAWCYMYGPFQEWPWNPKTKPLVVFHFHVPLKTCKQKHKTCIYIYIYCYISAGPPLVIFGRGTSRGFDCSSKYQASTFEVPEWSPANGAFPPGERTNDWSGLGSTDRSDSKDHPPGNVAVRGVGVGDEALRAGVAGGKRRESNQLRWPLENTVERMKLMMI